MTEDIGQEFKQEVSYWRVIVFLRFPVEEHLPWPGLVQETGFHHEGPPLRGSIGKLPIFSQVDYLNLANTLPLCRL